MSELNSLHHAFLMIREGKITDFGSEDSCPYDRADEVIDCSGRIVMPAFCDSHTHLVFASWREKEFTDRIKGLSYEEIAAKGGGILNSANKLQHASEDELFDRSLPLLHEVISMGTGAIEIKSGYGLTVESELKMLRVIQRLKAENLIPVKSTFLGAHAIPMAYKNNREAYIRQILDEMLPVVVDEGLADYIDVFCDRGFFTPEETDRILEAGAKVGLPPKIHANELGHTGGVEAGVRNKAVSVDHLEHTGEHEIAVLKNSDTIATLLPTVAFFLGLPYAPARQMIDAGVCVALASDLNPGSSPGGSMPFVLSLACIQMKMLPEEAIQGATINGAVAMGLSATYGSIAMGRLRSF